MPKRAVTLLIAALAALFVAAAAARPAAAATAPPPRTALLYRINAARADHGLRPVYPSVRLQLAASHHSDDMIVRDYFAHTSPTGSTVFTRIEHTGFVDGYAWIGGETLAWGAGTSAAPLATVTAWLASPEHRAIMLSPRFHWVGISRACGRYEHHAAACVWTADWVKRW
jgi:uncharacterized protein YkwD